MCWHPGRGASMLTLCLSSVPSETGLCLSSGWLLNQTVTFSFLGHLTSGPPSALVSLSISCLVCTSYHIFAHCAVQNSVQRGQSQTMAFTYWEIVGDGKTVFLLLTAGLFQSQVQKPGERNEQMNGYRGEGAILITVYELTRLTAEATVRSRYSSFCPQILHHDAPCPR